MDDQDRTSIRGALRAQRRDIAATTRIAGAQALGARLLALPFAPRRGHVAGYWAVDGEIALHAWQLGLPPDVTYCLPVLHGDGRLRFAPWQPGAPLQPNRHGIPEPDVPPDRHLEPEAMDMVVVPLVAFDARGHRLGMGAGWYDRSFAHRAGRPPPPWLVGAAFAMQQVEAIAPAPWDVPLDAVCSEQATVLFDRRAHEPPSMPIEDPPGR